MEHEIIKVEDDDPKRCQALISSQGQCNNRATEHSNFCPVHSGAMFEQKYEIKRLNNYRLHQWHQRVSELGTSPNIKNLRDEIAILRLVLEERLNKIEDSTDLILQSGPISDMVVKIDKVVNSCHKLEGSMGMMLDKSAVLQFANEVISIVSEELVGQEEKIALIADRIIRSLSKDKEEDAE